MTKHLHQIDEERTKQHGVNIARCGLVAVRVGVSDMEHLRLGEARTISEGRSPARPASD